METLTALPPVKYSITNSAIAELKQNYSGLTIAKDGLKAVHDARMIVKSKRVEIEKTRKSLKAESLEYGRQVDAEAKRITTELEAVETPLELEETAEEKRLQAIKDEEKRLAELELNTRISLLAKYGASHDISQLMTMPDEKFGLLLAEHKSAFDKAEADKLELLRLQKAEQERKEAEEKRLKAEMEEKQKKEMERIMAERNELEKRKAEQAAAQAKQDEINRKEREAIAKQKADFEEKQRKAQEAERIEKAKKEAAERAIKEDAVRKEKELKAAERTAKLAPDKEKLLAFASEIAGLKLPACKSTEAKEAVIKVSDLLKSTINAITETANNL